MGRPRLHNLNLPTGVYFKHGAYYKVVSGKWVRLGKDLPTTVADDAPTNLDRPAIHDYAGQLWRRARMNARGRRKIEFTLTERDVRRMLLESGWRCSVTGTPFSSEIISGKRPFAPSIDRIDSAKGYTSENCRVVCVAANYAMNIWGESVLHRLIGNTKKLLSVLDRH